MDYEKEDSDEGTNEQENAGKIINEPYPVRSGHEPLPALSIKNAPLQWANQPQGWTIDNG